MLVYQHAGTELRLVMFREGPADGIPQKSGENTEAVSVIPPGPHPRTGGCQPALRGNLYNCGLAVGRKHITRNCLRRLQNRGGVLPELDGGIFGRPDGIQKKLLSIGIRILHRLSSFQVSDGLTGLSRISLHNKWRKSGGAYTRLRQNIFFFVRFAEIFLLLRWSA